MNTYDSVGGAPSTGNRYIPANRYRSDGRQRPEFGSLGLVSPRPSPEILFVLSEAALEPHLE